MIGTTFPVKQNLVTQAQWEEIKTSCRISLDVSNKLLVNSKRWFASFREPCHCYCYPPSYHYPRFTYWSPAFDIASLYPRTHHHHHHHHYHNEPPRDVRSDRQNQDEQMSQAARVLFFIVGGVILAVSGFFADRYRAKSHARAGDLAYRERIITLVDNALVDANDEPGMKGMIQNIKNATQAHIDILRNAQRHSKWNVALLVTAAVGGGLMMGGAVAASQGFVVAGAVVAAAAGCGLAVRRAIRYADKLPQKKAELIQRNLQNLPLPIHYPQYLDEHAQVAAMRVDVQMPPQPMFVDMPLPSAPPLETVQPADDVLYAQQVWYEASRGTYFYPQ